VNAETLAHWGLLRQKQTKKVVSNNETCRNGSPETDDIKKKNALHYVCGDTFENTWEDDTDT